MIVEKDEDMHGSAHLGIALVIVAVILIIVGLARTLIWTT